MSKFFSGHAHQRDVSTGFGKARKPKRLSTVLTLCAALFCSAVSILPAGPAYSAPSPLHRVTDSLYTQDNTKFFMNGINLNDYMEFRYAPYRDCVTCFDDILSWLHTEEDYARIKAMGFNTVRLNLGEQHYTDHLQRVRDHVQWARDNNLYILLTYFAPPGSMACDGYYNELPFWHCIMDSGESCEYRTTFIQQWEAFFAAFQHEPHVLYELLNEPQIGSDTVCTSSQFCLDNPSKCESISLREGAPIYAGLIHDITAKLENYGEHILILDGLNLASANYGNFSFIPEPAFTYPNLAYTFHYYMSDIAWKGSKVHGEAIDPYRNSTRPFTTDNPGVKTISFSFTPSVDFIEPETKPYLKLVSLNQKGTYSIKSVTIKDAEETILFSENFADKLFAKYDYNTGEYVMSPSTGDYCDGPHPPESSHNCSLLLLDTTDRTRSWSLMYSGMFDSASASLIAKSADNVSVSNTMDRGKGADAVIDLRAVIPETDFGQYSDHPYPITLDPNQKYTVHLVVSGDSIDDNGTLMVFFYKLRDNAGTVLLQKAIRNVCGVADNCIEEPLSSHPERITAAFSIIKELSDQHTAPFFLGEFGVPLAEREPRAIDYFNAVTSATQNLSGWNMFQYREPFSNQSGPSCEFCSDYISFGLYAGWETTVQSMIWPVLSPDLSNALGTSRYYYRPDFISAIEAANGKTTQTITFEPLAGMTADDTGITLNATASSTLTTSFRSLTPTVCAVTGTALTLSHLAGTCTIRASQDGDAFFYAAMPVTRSFTVAAGAVDHFALSAIGAQIVASPFGITITAKDAYGNTAAGYVSAVNLATTAGTIYPTESGSFVGGMWTGGVVVNGAGSGKTITATDPGSSKIGVSSAFTVTKAAQTIMVSDTYRAPGSAAYGVVFAVGAAATSGLTIAISSSGACSGSGDNSAVITMTGSTGTCTINFTQAGDGDYTAAPQVTSETTATSAVQSIIVPDTYRAPATAAYGSIFVVGAAATSGLSVAITASGVCSGSGSNSAVITMTGSTGTCSIYYNQAGDGDYTAAPQVTSQTSATRAGQTIMMSDTYRAPGSAAFGSVFAVGAATTSGLTVAISSSGACSGSGSNSAVITMTGSTGICTINFTQAGDSNYTAAPQVTSTTTATKAEQSIVVPDTCRAPLSAAYGSVFAVGAAATSGLSVAITSSGVCSGSGSNSAVITMNSSTGTCTIYYNQAGDSNYTAAPQVSNHTSAGRSEQTIMASDTYRAPGSAVYGSTFVVASAATSGLPVEITTFGSCTWLKRGCDSGIDWAIINMTGSTGVCTVYYNQAGDGNYTSAPQVMSTTTANPAYVMRISGPTTGYYYSTLESALGAAEAGDEIRIQQAFPPGQIVDFNPSSPRAVTIRGGYNADFTSQTASTTVHAMIIRKGTVTVDHLIIQ